MALKVVKLSDNKIRLDYEVPLYSNKELVCHIKIKDRYKLSYNGILAINLPMKEGFANKLSMKFAVKKKFIKSHRTQTNMPVMLDDKEIYPNHILSHNKIID